MAGGYPPSRARVCARVEVGLSRMAEGVAEIVVARAHGDREGGAPLVVLALLLVGVVTLDAVGRGVVALVRRLILDGRLRRHS